MTYEKARAEIITFVNNSSFMAASRNLPFGYCGDFEWTCENYGEFTCKGFVDNGKYDLEGDWNEYKCKNF